jgi:hypothetical protein
LFAKFESYIVTARADDSMHGGSWCSFLESFAVAKAGSCFSSFRFSNLRLLEICSWSWCGLFDVFILTVLWSWVNVCWSCSSFLRHNATIHRVLASSLLFNHLFLIYYCSFTLIHSSHCFAGKIRRSLVIIKRTDGWTLVGAWTNRRVNFLLYFFAFRLWPWDTSRLSLINSRIVLSRSYFISFLSFEILNRRLIQF